VQDSQNLTIGVLSITAVVLLVGVVLTVVGGQNQARAIGQTAWGGDYIVATGQFTQNSELVYVMDARARRLNAYSFDKTRRQLIYWHSQDLGGLLGGAGAFQESDSERGRPSRRR
jgi:hypothetical protein